MVRLERKPKLQDSHFGIKRIKLSVVFPAYERLERKPEENNCLSKLIKTSPPRSFHLGHALATGPIAAKRSENLPC